jgi:hypothetical protein
MCYFWKDVDLNRTILERLMNKLLIWICIAGGLCASQCFAAEEQKQTPAAGSGTPVAAEKSAA